MQADVILKEPPPIGATSASKVGSHRGGRRAWPPPLYTFFHNPVFWSSPLPPPRIHEDQREFGSKLFLKFLRHWFLFFRFLTGHLVLPRQCIIFKSIGWNVLKVQGCNHLYPLRIPDFYSHLLKFVLLKFCSYCLNPLVTRQSIMTGLGFKFIGPSFLNQMSSCFIPTLLIDMPSIVYRLQACNRLIGCQSS